MSAIEKVDAAAMWIRNNVEPYIDVGIRDAL